MTKTEAIYLLGGTPAAAAAEIGITSSAFSQWPEELSKKLRDRVQAALWRRQQSGRPAPMPHPQVAVSHAG